MHFYILYKTWMHASFLACTPRTCGILGLKAAYALVVHEMAHTIQVQNGKRKRNSMHNSYWAATVQMLQENYPLSEFVADL